MVVFFSPSGLHLKEKEENDKVLRKIGKLCDLTPSVLLVRVREWLLRPHCWLIIEAGEDSQPIVLSLGLWPIDVAFGTCLNGVTLLWLWPLHYARADWRWEWVGQIGYPTLGSGDEMWHSNWCLSTVCEGVSAKTIFFKKITGQTKHVWGPVGVPCFQFQYLVPTISTGLIQ